MADEAPYKQSRAALRRLYGTRRIDASAPYSAADSTPSAMAARAPGGFRDDTPSGREREMRQRGVKEENIQDAENRSFQNFFRNAQPTGVIADNPAGSAAAAGTDPNMRAGQFFASLQSRTPQGGRLPYNTFATASAGAPPPINLFPEQSEDAASILGDLGGTPVGSLFAPMRPRFRRSVLDSATRFLTA